MTETPRARGAFWRLVLIPCLAAAAPAGARDIEVRRIFGPEAPAPYKHPASMTELDGGDLYLVYYGGSGEYASDTAVHGSRLSRPGGKDAGPSGKWSPPRIIADTPWRSEGNAVVWQAPGGLVWLFYVVRYGETWASSRIQAKVSRDGAETWSDSILLTTEEGTMVRGRPIVLAGGDYLLPVYHEVGTDIEKVSADCTSFFLRMDPAKKTWTETPRIRSRLGNIQPAVAAITDDHLVAYCRRGGDYEGQADGWLVRSESRDRGKTWSPGQDSRFPNPNAAVDLLRLRSGNLLLVFNDSMKDRTPLTAAISRDGDATYPLRRDIVRGPGDFAYPFAIQTRDGKIHVVFTSEERTVVNEAVFDEEEIAGG